MSLIFVSLPQKDRKYSLEELVVGKYSPNTHDLPRLTRPRFVVENRRLNRDSVTGAYGSRLTSKAAFYLSNAGTLQAHHSFSWIIQVYRQSRVKAVTLKGRHLEGWAQDCSNSNIFLKPLFRGNFDPFVNNANLGAIAHTSNGT